MILHWFTGQNGDHVLITLPRVVSDLQACLIIIIVIIIIIILTIAILITAVVIINDPLDLGIVSRNVLPHHTLLRVVLGRHSPHPVLATRRRGSERKQKNINPIQI